MKKENYVSIEVAKLLREKGFNEFCGAYYHLSWRNEATEDECFEVAPSYDFRNSDNTYRVGAPTLYEAHKWLREKYNIHLDPKIICFNKPTQKADYICDIHSLMTRQYKETKIYNSYEEALNAGVLEALKLI